MTQVDFAIITIREDEFKAVLQRFPQKPQTGSSGRIYGISQIKTQAGQACTAAIVRSAVQGNDASQQLVYDIISDLDPQMLLLVGIAGGVPNDDFTLGDVIISNRIDNFSVDKRSESGNETFAMTGSIDPATSNIAASLLLYEERFANWNASVTLPRPEVDLSQFNTETFNQKTTNETDPASSKWHKNLKKYTTRHFSNPRNPLFTTGRIASINYVVRSTSVLFKFLQDARNIMVVEMETPGIYQAVQGTSQRYPVMAIRGISDIIGLQRDDKWTKYACQTAAAFTYAFVSAGIVSSRAIPTVKEAKTVRWEDIQRTLRSKLAELFPQEQSIHTIVRDIDSPTEAFVRWNGSSHDLWSDILFAVRSRHLELALIEAVLAEYPQDETLKKAKNDIMTLTSGSTVPKAPS